MREEYKVVKSIASGIKDVVEKAFNDPVEQWAENLENFERSYKSNYGIFYTSFVIEIDKQFDFINKQEFSDKADIISHYANLKEISRDIGEVAVSTLENLKSVEVGKLSTAEFQDLKHRSLLKFNLIINECDEMIEKL